MSGNSHNDGVPYRIGMGVDQVAKHDHSSDADGGADIAPHTIDASETVTGTGSPAIDAQGNVRLATGGRIEDGAGDRRLEIASGYTFLRANSNSEPDLTLSTDGDNARVRILDTQNFAVLDATNGVKRLSVGGTGPVEIGNNTNLRLGIGQVIEDKNGTTRLEIASDRTDLRFENGGAALRAREGVYNRVYARSGTPFQVFDREGGGGAITYKTDATEGDGTLTISADTHIKDGSASAPALAFKNDTDTGLYRNGADDFRVVTGGATRMVFGAGDPTLGSGQNFDLSGGIIYRAGGAPDANRGAVRLANNAEIGWTDSTDSNNVFTKYDSSDNFIWAVGGTGGAEMSLKTSPSGSNTDAVFQVAGGPKLVNSGVRAPDGSVSSPALTFDSDTDTGIYRSTEDTLVATTGGSGGLRVDSDQNVEIPNGGVYGSAGSVNFNGSDFYFTARSTADLLFRDSNGITLFQVLNGGSVGVTNGAQFNVADGSASTPAIAPESDTDTGVYKWGSDQLGFSTGGTEAGKFGSRQNLNLLGNDLSGVGGSDFAREGAIRMGDPTGASGGIMWKDQGGGTEPGIYLKSDGEVYARDDDGNETQLT